MQTDDEKAIELLFRQYYQYVCKSVVRIISEENVAEDLAQEIFFEIWKRRQEIQITSVKAYLRRAATNKALNYVRDKKIHFDEEDEIDKLETPTIGVQKLLETAELQELIDQSIDTLPERCRLVFVLSRFEELSYQEIADKLDISIKTVENQISKALKLLREKLGDYLNTG